MKTLMKTFKRDLCIFFFMFFILPVVSAGAYSNIAPSAAVAASSESASTGQLATKAVDQVIDGYPGDYRREWSTAGQRTGAWLRLTWTEPYAVDRVILYDRPNASDRIVGARLSFSDGSTLTVGSLNNDGTATEYRFTVKVITSLTMTVTQVSSQTLNVGLAEIEVFGDPDYGNHAPIANAGADQTVSEGAVVTMNGSGSSDPDDDPLNYRWEQIGGTAVQLSDPETIRPVFTAPSGLTSNEVLTFTLVVDDGLLFSEPGTVRVTVLATGGSYRNMAPSAAVTASSESVSTGQLAVKAVDQVIDGYPGDYRREWSTAGQRVGAWLRLTWTEPFAVDRVVLYDRPNSSDQIVGARLSFSDGSTLTVGALNNGGTATEFRFTSRVITSLTMTVIQVSSQTLNVGLAEIEVFGAPEASYQNIAPSAAVTASSESTATGQLAVKAVDQVIDGYPGDYRREWATAGQRAGAWLRLTWPEPFAVDRVVLYDRPNSSDQIVGARLSFSDGSTLTVGPLNNGGTATEYPFSEKIITSLTMTVTQVSSQTSNVGLAEIQVFGNPHSQPFLKIIQPEDYHLQVSTDLDIFVDAYYMTGGTGVRFAIDGGTANGGQEYDDYPSPYGVTFGGLSLSEHTIDAWVIDAYGTLIDGEYTHDSVSKVGIGNYYVAIGDSITYGYGDDDHSDDFSLDGRNRGGGFEPILNDLLTTRTGIPHTIINEGVGGTRSVDGRNSIATILAKHPEASHFLVLYGTNDSDHWYSIPSGKGLQPGDPGYPGSFKYNLQQIINAINNAGKKVFLAKVPIALGEEIGGAPYPNPDLEPRNLLIREYNEVIDELVSDPSNKITGTPPDLYNYFNYYNPQTGRHNYENEYADILHPNGLGYRSMANLWFERLVQ